MRTKLLAALVSLSLLSFSEPPKLWSHRIPINTAAKGWARLEVPLTLLPILKGDMSDLRFFDKAGEERPFMPLALRPTGSVQNVSPFEVTLADSATLVFFQVPPGTLVESLRVGVDGETIYKAASLESSSDGQSFHPLLQQVPFWKPRDKREGEISLPRGGYRFLRLRLDDSRSPAVPVTGVSVVYAPPEGGPVLPLPMEIRALPEAPGRFEISHQGAHAHLAFLDFAISVPARGLAVSLMARTWEGGERQWVVLARGRLGPAARLAVEKPLPAGDLVLEVEEEGGEFPKLTGVRGFRRPAMVAVHLGDSGKHYLYGGNPRAGDPGYDRGAMLAGASGAMELPNGTGTLEANPDFVASEMPGAGLGAELDPGAWKVHRPLMTRGPGPSAFLTDLEMLARSPGLEDARLVMGRQQIPYLLEREAVVSNLILTATRTNTGAVSREGMEPKRTSWALSLPVVGVPVSRISIQAKDPFFKRTLWLYALVRDERQDLAPRFLGKWEWQRDPDEKSRALAISLPITPRLEGFRLDLDEGDNRPLSLSQVTGEVALARFIFRAPPGSNIQLLYGNTGVFTPRYDLTLGDPGLANGPWEAVWVGPPKVGNANLFSLGHFPPWLLWVALGLVAAVLLGVIGRMLPKKV